MKEQVRERPEILAAAERQMQNWVMNQETEVRASRAQNLDRLTRTLNPYIAISREEGVDGSDIARLVGERLGWNVLDKELLDRVANRFGLSRMMLQIVDETQGNWVYDVLGIWMDRNIVSHEKYVALLSRVILAAARNEKCVLVGRGAQFLLPQEKGLSVRIIARQKYRIEKIMQRDKLSAAAARRTIEETDSGRREFVERYFHHDIDDPHLYDLVINVEHLGTAGAVDHIIMALRQRHVESVALET